MPDNKKNQIMRNFKNNRRRFRSNSFDKGFKINNLEKNIHTNIGNTSELKKRNFQRNNFNFSKLIQNHFHIQVQF